MDAILRLGLWITLFATAVGVLSLLRGRREVKLAGHFVGDWLQGILIVTVIFFLWQWSRGNREENE